MSNDDDIEVSQARYKPGISPDATLTVRAQNKHTNVEIRGPENAQEIAVKGVLMPLDEWNARGLVRISNSNSPTKNGLACPKCGNELIDSSPGYVLYSAPPKTKIHCDCGFTGYRNL